MKILVISLAGIGDTLFTIPLIRELRINFPEAVIDALVMWPGAKDLLQNNPDINHVFQKDLIKCGPIEGVKYLLSLRRRENYQWSVNTHPQSRIHYRIAAWLVGAKMRFSHEYECFKWFDKLLINKSLPQNYSIHSINNNLAVLPLMGARLKLPAHELRIHLGAEELEWVNKFLYKHKLKDKKWIGIHTGSGGTKNLALRRWPLNKFIELVQKLQEQRNSLPILFFGGPEEKKDYEKIREAIPTVIFPPTENLRQAVALLQYASGFLSVDTALMHLAAVAKVPAQIVIETPTWNKPIEPFGNPFTLIKNSSIGGRNLEFYRYDGCGIKGSRQKIISIMQSVEVADVFAVIMKLI